jgi:hypothetical protein
LQRTPAAAASSSSVSSLFRRRRPGKNEVSGAACVCSAAGGSWLVGARRNWARAPGPCWRGRKKGSGATKRRNGTLVGWNTEHVYSF